MDAKQREYLVDIASRLCAECNRLYNVMWSDVALFMSREEIEIKYALQNWITLGFNVT